MASVARHGDRGCGHRGKLGRTPEMRSDCEAQVQQLSDFLSGLFSDPRIPGDLRGYLCVTELNSCLELHPSENSNNYTKGVCVRPISGNKAIQCCYSKRSKALFINHAQSLIKSGSMRTAPANIIHVTRFSWRWGPRSGQIRSLDLLRLLLGNPRLGGLPSRAQHLSLLHAAAGGHWSTLLSPGAPSCLDLLLSPSLANK